MISCMQMKISSDGKEYRAGIVEMIEKTEDPKAGCGRTTENEQTRC